MARAASVDPSDRLPWLSEAAPKPAPQRSRVPVVLMALAAGAAGAAGWTALQRAVAPEQVTIPAETVRLPPPIAAKPVERAAPPVSDREALALPPAPSTRASEPAPPPKARPASKAKAPAARPKPSARKRSVSRARAATPAPSAGVARSSPAYDPRAWNSGVAGRIIQLGAFTSPAQANGQWNRVYYRYPLLRPLPPRVVRTNIRGRTFYRLQLGTFSHAHSEMLCQRLRAIGEGCIVLGLKRRGRRA